MFGKRERGLRQISHAIGIGNDQISYFLHGRNHLRYIRRLTLRTLNLIVIAMADQDQRVPLLGELDRLHVNLRHQRAGCIDDLQAAFLCTLANRGRDTVGRVDHSRAFRNLVQLIDEDRALFRQIVHDIAVVHDLFAHVDGSAKGIESNLHNVDCPHNAGAEAAGLQQEDTFGLWCSAVLVNSRLVKSGCRHVSSIPRYTDDRYQIEPWKVRSRGRRNCKDFEIKRISAGVSHPWNSLFPRDGYSF